MVESKRKKFHDKDKYYRREYIPFFATPNVMMIVVPECRLSSTCRLFFSSERALATYIMLTPPPPYLSLSPPTYIFV